MQISEVMTTDVKIANPDQTIAQAARMMQDLDAGILPVADGDRLVGMISDRDIAIRAVAAGKSPDTAIREIKLPRYERWGSYEAFLPGNIERFCEFIGRGF